ncbi:hypothetical protein SAMN04487851_10476 [Prevotella sp. tc2-28]|nr:hypothetical protein SAMN04487851_10476 [Prevotella sp. tc2-28]
MTLRHPHFFIYHLGPKPVISHFTFLIYHLELAPFSSFVR